MRIAEAIAEQVAANQSGLGHEASFAEHRARLTRELLERAPAGGVGRLCLLGAGNANDVDLGALASAFAEVHLVDIDAASVARARARVPGPAQERLLLHAPVDASGLFADIERWARARLPPAVSALAGELPTAVAHVV